MPCGTSIHIGVNRPAGGHYPLRYSEAAAWKMAALAVQAGYGSLHLLRGDVATRDSVLGALSRAAASLVADDTLLVTFSGHGSRTRDANRDERDGSDESWCLADGELPDDCLKECWRAFNPGVRIVLVLECCHAAGAVRTDYDELFFGTGAPAYRPPPTYRGAGGGRGDGDPPPVLSCVEPPRDADGIQAGILLFAACGEAEPARDGTFSNHLLRTWQDGAFQGSYCELLQEVRRRVQKEGDPQRPELALIGAADPGLPLACAFHLVDPRIPVTRYR
jgi:metacaspase-1